MGKRDEIIDSVVAQIADGRYIGPTRNGNFFKRWSVADGNFGLEFRPFNYSDYGYVDGVRAAIEWTIFVIQASVIVREQGWKRATLFHFLAFLDNELLMPKWRSGNIGSNFVTSYQTGWLLYHGMINHNVRSKHFGIAGLGWDVFLAIQEKFHGFEFGDMVNYDVRTSGIAGGATLAFVVDLFKKFK